MSFKKNYRLTDLLIPVQSRIMDPCLNNVQQKQNVNPFSVKITSEFVNSVTRAFRLVSFPHAFPAVTVTGTVSLVSLTKISSLKI